MPYDLTFKSDGLPLPMTRRQFEHWLARWGSMPKGSSPEVYKAAGNLAWKAYRRGRDDQKKVER